MYFPIIVLVLHILAKLCFGLVVEEGTLERHIIIGTILEKNGSSIPNDQLRIIASGQGIVGIETVKTEARGLDGGVRNAWLAKGSIEIRNKFTGAEGKMINPEDVAAMMLEKGQNMVYFSAIPASKSAILKPFNDNWVLATSADPLSVGTTVKFKKMIEVEQTFYKIHPLFVPAKASSKESEPSKGGTIGLSRQDSKGQDIL